MPYRRDPDTMDYRDLRFEVASIALYDEAWDDLRFPVQGITLAGLSTPPDTQADTGLLLFDNVAIESVSVLAQLPHSWKQESAIVPHIHWAKTSDAAGDVVWTMRYKWFNVGEVQGAWSDVIVGTDALTIDATQKQNITTFGKIDGTDKRISSLVLMQIGRLPTAPEDDYAADALLYEIDIHYQVNGFGSQEEFIKVEDP